MQKHAPALIAVLMVAPAARADDGYLQEMRARCARVRPHVEKEIGRKLGEVEIVVATREEVANNALPLHRQVLARVENGPRGDELERQARAIADGGSHWIVARVDRLGRIVFPDPDEKPGLVRFLAGFLPRSEAARDPGRPDLVMVHELVHVHQHRHLEPKSFLESVRSRADILARRAVLEGHAEHVSRRVARRMGLEDVYAKIDRVRTGLAAPEDAALAAVTWYPYVQGEAFVAAVVAKLGYDEAVARIFARPPTLAQVSRPETYLDPPAETSSGSLFEDLRRWLARERGEADLSVLTLPWARALAGDAAEAFREGCELTVGYSNIVVRVLRAGDEDGARALHATYTATLASEFDRNAARADSHVRLHAAREADSWSLHGLFLSHHQRRTVRRAGRFVVDVTCWPDSGIEQGAERLAGRAARFVHDPAWRAAWLAGDPKLLEDDDPGLRIAAASRLGRPVADDDWEVRWAALLHSGEDERAAAALEDRHPGVVARALRAWGASIPAESVRPLLQHAHAAVRREAWKHPATEAPADILAALEDDDQIVREWALNSLPLYAEGEELIPLFRRALADPHRRVRSFTLSALAVRTEVAPELVPDIVARIADNAELAAEALGRVGEPAATALPRLRKLLHDPDACDEAAVAIWRISGEKRPLFRVVRESVAAGKPRGIDVLGEMGADARPLVPDVAQVLQHDYRWTRQLAASVLGKIGGADAREALERRRSVETAPPVRTAIEEALAEIPDE